MVQQEKQEMKNTSISSVNKKMSDKTYRFVLISIHSVVLVLSVISLICGLYVYIDHQTYHEAWHVSYGVHNSSVICIIISLILLIISVLGIVGTAKINYCLLMGYNIVLGLVVVTEIGLAISLFVLAKNGLFKNVLEDKLIHSLEHFNQDGYPGVTKAWNLIQTELNCCGVSKASDWFQQSSLYPKLPASCCAYLPAFGPNKDECHIDNQVYGPFEKGCLTALETAVCDNAGLIGGVVAVVAIIQIAVIICTSFIMKKSEKPKSCPPFY